MHRTRESRFLVLPQGLLFSHWLSLLRSLQKNHRSQLIELAKSTVLACGAITATFDPKDLKEGTA
jgi:hypothetical protein